METELTKNQTEQVIGGFAVDGGNGKYYAVDDKDGTIYTITNVSLEYAQWAAVKNGQSKNVITKEEYQKRFGKPIC